MLLVSLPPVQSPCGDPDALSCATIDARLDSLSTAYSSLASTKSVTFVGVYDIFSSHPDFGEAVGRTNSLYRHDGLHPRLAMGDDLIAASVASTLLSDIIRG